MNCVSVFGAVCDFFVCVGLVSPEPLNGFAPNSQGTDRGKTCLVPRSDEFEGQGPFRRPARGLCLEKNIFDLVIFVFEALYETLWSLDFIVSDGMHDFSGRIVVGNRIRHSSFCVPFYISHPISETEDKDKVSFCMVSSSGESDSLHHIFVKILIRSLFTAACKTVIFPLRDERDVHPRPLS